MSTAEEILSAAHADPGETLLRAAAYLISLDVDEYQERTITLRAMSLATRHTQQIDDSIEYARQAAETAATGGYERLRLLALLTMTGSLAISGRIGEALGIIEETTVTAREPDLLARFQFQRGAVLQDLGRAREAVEAFEKVLPSFREADDQSAVGWTLNNLGRNLTALGRLDEAEQHLLESLAIAENLGERAEVHGIEHNLGRLASYRGDIPTALEWLQKSDDHSMEVSGAAAPLHVARSEVLASAGLYIEARELAEEIANENEKNGDLEHAGNALIVAAEAALSGGSLPEAMALAERTIALIDEETGPDRRRSGARRIRNEARFVLDGPSYELLDDVSSVAVDLDRFGLIAEAGQAHLLAGRTARSLGEHSIGRRHLERLAKERVGPIETRLQAHLARALLGVDDEDARTAAGAVRSGLNLLDNYQAALGASDLRSGIERQGRELASIGLQLALDSGRPRRILEWLDRTRARALRYAPVVPIGDDEVAGALAQLRRVEAELRQPESRDDRALHLQRKRLHEEIVRADRVRRKTRPGDSAFSIGALVDSLRDRTLFEVGEHDSRLFAVRVKRGRARLIELGNADETARELSHLRFAMRRSARRGRPVDVEALHRLDQMLFAGLDLGDDVVIVPPASLIATPWAGLPSLRGRSVQVSPSAEMWWQARHREPTGDSVVIAGGPDLELADQEVEAVGRLHTYATLLPPGVGVDEVRSALSGSRIAHIASHATFQVQNPMFSSLRLGDGDLNVYDIERLEAPPSLVVLSACDSGYTEARAGDELAGLTSALLSMGSRSVVASVGLVPDATATSDLMVDFHRGLVEGLDAARALSRAQSGMLEDPERFVSAASFVCVGA